ncbi:putative GTP binding domain, P-loop containing nucleoside triphosphate hydrolase [Helianthus annuus]|nr:putative GTP binding domain, P-loop containing nucleoside triphosphate hydrolase [Helianthus annuus]
MAFLTHFPFHPIHHHSSSLFTRLLFSSKPKTLLILSALSSPQTSLSHFSTTSSLETLQDISITEQTHLQIAQEKLFIPPDTEICSEKGPRILKGSNIVLSKYARDAQVVSAEFVKSSVETEACPADGLPEFALVGRSNVGKSSLLNSIVKRKKLAMTSKKPGMHTRCSM